MYKYNIVLMSYNKAVVCILDKGKPPVCEVHNFSYRRHTEKVSLLSHEPYLPTIKNGAFYQCTNKKCDPVEVNSITQVATAEPTMKICYQGAHKHSCAPLKYLYYKDIDKLLFLENNIQGKTYYLVDCLAYSDGGRVCHKSNGSKSHADLINTGAIVRPKDNNVLSQDEMICEEDVSGKIYCDLNQYVSYADGLKKKESLGIDKKIVMKSGASLVILQYKCIGSWCGYTGNYKYKMKSRREQFSGRMYRCYYAKKQQVCKIMKESDSVFHPIDD